jgi:predicted ATP-grasp superfamily ATP-dependent carboligase
MDALILRSSPNALSAARSLGRAGLEVVVAARGSDPAVRFSRYVSRVERLDDIDDAAIDRLLRLSRDGERPFLLATGDQDALLVAKHQDALREKFCFVCPSHSALEAIIDKASLYETARAHGIPRPRFHVVRAARDVEPAIDSVATPCYVKPALAHEWRRFRRGKLVRADSPEELRRALQDFIEIGVAAIPIEIIPGSDSEVYSVSTYIDRQGRPVGWRTKRKLRQFPLHAGDGCAQEICDAPEVAELGLRLLAVAGHRGPATVEFRRDARNGRFVLIEVNARTILAQEMITRSGFDVPLIAYHDANGLPLPPPRPARRVRWVFFGADYRASRELAQAGQLTMREWLRSLVPCRSFAYFAADDPKPFLARLALWLRRKLTGRVRRTPGASLPGAKL